MADDRLIAVWTVALHTGLRRGELAGLRWTDIDLRGGTITVAQQRTTANHAIVVTTPKAKSQRQLLLAPATVAALKGHRQRQRQERMALGPAWTDSKYVFVDEAGVEYHPHADRPGRFRIGFESHTATMSMRCSIPTRSAALRV